MFTYLQILFQQSFSTSNILPLPPVTLNNNNISIEQQQQAAKASVVTNQTSTIIYKESKENEIWLL